MATRGARTWPCGTRSSIPTGLATWIYVSGTGIDGDRRWHADYKRNLRRRLGDHLARWEALKNRARHGDEEREFAILQWSADFAEPNTALQQAERLATPWFEINYDCNAAINAEVTHDLRAADIGGQCQALGMPVLIVDGIEDIRPRWAVDSLHRALPNAQRVSLTGAGHLPWVEDAQGFHQAVTSFLAERH